MTSYKVPHEVIDNFLSLRRIAVVGVSRDPRNFSVAILRELSRSGYDVVPVNPHATEIEGLPCYARVQDIFPPVDGAVLMTSPALTEEVVRDCAYAGINHVWMFRGAGDGAVSLSAVAFCWERGIEVVPGECPLMFLPRRGFIHALHGFVRRIKGSYPRYRAA